MFRFVSNGVYRLLIAIPLVILALNALFLVRWGVDLPFWDDWRQYGSNDLGSFKLSYLFTPVNDTLYPVGKFLDSLALRSFGAHAVAYQLLSLVAVLGALLWLIWQLLGLSEAPRLVRALAFCFTLPMLQPDSYWGLQNLAYHQTLPLIAVLAILYLVLRLQTAADNSWPTYIGIGLLGFLSGFSYISGAFAIVGLSAVLLLYGGNYRRYGWALVVPAVICLLAQLWVIIFYQKGMHLAEYGMAYPWQIDFWMYALGKVSRAFLLSPAPQYAVWSLALTFLVLGAWGLLLWRRPSLLLVALTVVIGLYLLIVAAGRANYRYDHVISPLQVYEFGFARFHYFWLTLIWPFLVMAAWQLKKSRLIGVLAVIPVIWLSSTAVLHHSNHYEWTMNLRQQGLECIQTQYAEGQTAIGCPTVHPIDTPDLLPADIRPAIQNAIQRKASFVEQLKPLP